MLNAEVTKHVLRRYLSPAGFRLSASVLELYARCPFRYFLTTLLGLSPLEDPEQVFSLHPRDRGGLLHDILYEFFSRLRQNHLFPLATQERRALTNMLMEIAEKHFQTFARTGTTGFALPWELERERMLECLTSLLSRECEADDGFVPTAFEVHFGGEEAQREGDTESGFFPSQAVQFVLADGEEIALRGRIDRIDLSADQQRARVIDYKTGKPVRGRFARGTALQLPLYLFAARALRPEHMWVSAEYAYVDRSGRSGRASFTEDTWADTLKTLRQIVTVLVGGIRSGYFFATPESCYPCPFPLICGSHAETCAARKQTDPRVELLCRIRVIE
jgi:ATP-dependent helicase/DNAse subunit B